MPRCALLFLAPFLLSACVGPSLSSSERSEGDADDADSYRAEIRWTSYGIPHIEAEDFGSLGFGTGYAFATLNACVLADIVLTVGAERSRHLGPEDGNLQSDLFHQRLIDERRAERLLEGDPESGFVPSPEARALVRGFAEGYNTYLRETGADGIPDPSCRGADWVREIDELDLWRRTAVGATTLLGGIVSAAPPGAPASSSLPDTLLSPPDRQRAALASEELVLAEGSNAWAFGRELTGGGGVLLANPHYPWSGENRFYRLHQTIPGVLDVTGAALMGTPLVGIGHTDRLAWTHTVSTARRHTLFELELDPEDPTRYVHDGETRAMIRQEVRVPVRMPDDSVVEEAHTFYRARFGPVVESEALPWTETRAYAIRNADAGLRSIDQRLAWYQADDVHELDTVLTDYLAVGFNTIAVDRDGNAYYGDVGPVPNVPDERAEACAASATARSIWDESRIPVLDGTRSECEWNVDEAAAVPGLLGPDDLPRLVRGDFAANSNNSYWLTNPEAPITGLGRILGEEEVDIGLRPRLGLLMIRDRLEDADGNGRVDLEDVQDLMFNNRHYGGELLRDELVELCQTTPEVSVEGRTIDLAEACDVLESWDVRVGKKSRGAHLFREFSDSDGIRFTVPFDAEEPLETPHTLDSDDPQVGRALGEAVHRLREADIPLDARLGDVQYRRCDDQRVPIHGGRGGDGVFNLISAPFQGPDGYPGIVSGASFVMAAELTEGAPRSEAILAYSQATENPESPHHCDQTRLYSEKEWLDMRFTDEAIRADPTLRIEVVEGGAGS